MPDNNNFAVKTAPKAVSGTKPVATPLAKSDGAPIARTASKAPVPPASTTDQNPLRVVQGPASKILFGVFGAAGGIGKSLVANVVAALYRTAKMPVQMIRMESEVRREEFGHDAFIALDEFPEALQRVGGVSGLFDDAWALIEKSFAESGVAIMDGGANSHDKFITLATETGLAQLVADQGGMMILLVAVTRDAEMIRQSVELIAELCDCAPEAEIIIALNERDGRFLDDATPEGVAYRERLAPLLQRHAHVTMPFAGARAIAAFASCGCSIPTILTATNNELRQWSGLGLLAARSCQTHLGAFYYDVASQFEQVLPFRTNA